MKSAMKLANHVEKRETCCIQCAKCAEVCPVGLYPVFIKEAIEDKNLEKAKRLYLHDCITCVLCTDACPSGIALADIFRKAKGEIQNSDKETDHIDLPV